MSGLPTLAHSRVFVHIQGTDRPFATRVIGQRGRRLLLAIPVGRAPAGAWAKPGAYADIVLDAEAHGKAPAFRAVVCERRLKPIPLLLVEAQGDVPLVGHRATSAAAAGPRGATVIGVTSGKGGTGKTTCATNLAWHLATLGRRTLLVDADIGAANCHLHFGIRPHITLAALFAGDSPLVDLAYPVTSRLFVVAGISGRQGEVDPSPWQFSRLITAIEGASTAYDYIVVDTGAGVHPGVTNLLLLVGEVVLVSGADPASILGAQSLLARLGTEETGGVRRVGVVVNRVPPGDPPEQTYAAVSHGTRSMRGTTLYFAGAVADDSEAVTALKAGRPLVAAVPQAAATADFRRAFQAVLRRVEPVLPCRLQHAISRDA